jgi:hypothetical protein
MKRWLASGLLVVALAVPRAAQAQHLGWPLEVNGRPMQRVTFLYGEMEVLASGPGAYFCGAGWYGAYSGIQEPFNLPKLTIFSVWDTSPKLHPRVVQADDRTVYKRFGGEGTGAHSHLNYPWEIGKVFKFALTKETETSGANTLITYYFFDDYLNRWVLEATISSPTDNKDWVRYFVGPYAFLENWTGQGRETPRLCLFRLWAGASPTSLIFLRKATGDGSPAVLKGTSIAAGWGVLNNSFYLAQASDASALEELLAKQPKTAGSVLPLIKGGKAPLFVPTSKLSDGTIAALKALPKPSPQPMPDTPP